MRKRIFDSALCLWLLITGCATPIRPRIRVTGTDSILVGLKLTDEMLKLGYDIREQSGHSIVFEKQLTDLTIDTWFGGRYDMHPSSRVSYMLIEQDGTVRVDADLKIIINPGSRFEHVADATQHPDSTSIQKVLRQIKHYLEHQKKQDPQNTDGNASPRQLK